jgi:ATP diphosphatase
MKRYNLTDLSYLMERLRDPMFGCPWDLKQDFVSIIPYTLEECYEVIDAIETQDWPHLAEELGDLLFQIMFYSQLGKEQQLFDLDDVIHLIVEKLIRRHPHVFAQNKLHSHVDKKFSEAEIATMWEDIKSEERAAKGVADNRPDLILADIPDALPALMRAEKLQRRAAKVGFDWNSLTPVIEKIEEELAELKEAVISQDLAHIKDEMGDFIFAQVNLARHLGINAEEALRGTNQKFCRRFNYVETQVMNSGKDWDDFQLNELEAYWKDAKQRGL